MRTFSEFVAHLLSWLSYEEAKAELQTKTKEGSESVYKAGRKDTLKEVTEKVNELLED